MTRLDSHREQALTTPVQRFARSHLKQPRPATKLKDPGRIAVLIGPGQLPWIMVNGLADHFGALTVLEETREPASRFLKRRLKLLGPITVAGQIAFGLYLKYLHARSEGRKRAIMKCLEMTSIRPENCVHHHIGSVNSAICRERLREIDPDVVVVIGTRMIRSQTLDSIAAPFINYHAGLNPKYRGMNGGYWAYATGDEKNAGVTVHLIDRGVDTGRALYTANFTAGARENFVTYPYLQASAAKPLLNRAVEDALFGELKTDDLNLPSKQWFHPTLWSYIWTGLTRKVW